MDSVFERVKRILIEQLGLEDSDIVDDANFKNDLGADSLDVIELAMEIEEEFHIEIPDELFDGDEIATVGRLVNYVSKNIRD